MKAKFVIHALLSASLLLNQTTSNASRGKPAERLADSGQSSKYDEFQRSSYIELLPSMKRHVDSDTIARMNKAYKSLKGGGNKAPSVAEVMSHLHGGSKSSKTKRQLGYIDLLGVCVVFLPMAAGFGAGYLWGHDAGMERAAKNEEERRAWRRKCHDRIGKIVDETRLKTALSRAQSAVR